MSRWLMEPLRPSTTTRTLVRYPGGMTPPLTDRDTDAEITREARRIVRRLAEVWPRDTLREAEAFLAETEPPKSKIAPDRGRW